MLKRPPQHAADATPFFISESDDAWDFDRIAAETKAMPKGEQHPVARYHAGETRYDLDATFTMGGQTVTVRDYLKGSPTVFELRRVRGVENRKTAVAFGDGPAFQERMWSMTKLGVCEVRDGFDGASWDLQGGQRGMPLTDQDVQAIYDCDAMLVLSLGMAVFHVSQPLSEAEGKR